MINTTLTQIRIYVEHAIRGIKIYQITSTIFRNTTERMADLVMKSLPVYTWKCLFRDGTPAVAT